MKFIKLSRKARMLFFAYVLNVLMINFGVVPVFAVNDPLTVVNNLSTFIFSLIRATWIWCSTGGAFFKIS